MSIWKSIYLIPLLFLSLSACTAQQTNHANSNITPAGLDRLYQEALDKAKYPSEDKISKNLTALTKQTDKLIYNDNGQILMTTFTKASYYKKRKKGEEPFNLYGETWFTAAPFLQEFCKAYKGDNLLLRTQQLLGLPPKIKTENITPNDSIVSLWVTPSDIYRPCADPEISDTTCVITLTRKNFDTTPSSDFTNGKNSWGNINSEIKIDDKGNCVENSEGTLQSQVSQNYVTVNGAHLNWMACNWKKRYQSDALHNRYPWTALGYTFDWANVKNPEGLSEFVSKGGTEVVFESSTPLATYCGR